MVCGLHLFMQEQVQTPEHVLQERPTLTDLRKQTWPQGSELRWKLWGCHEDLTLGFILETGLLI